MMRPATLLRALALGLALVAGPARSVSPLGDIPLETNVYTAAETDAAITAASAAFSALVGDYATVSNRAMSAVQAETDPSVSAWAKAATKPAYTYAEIGALPASPLAGASFDFATNKGLYLAVSNLVTVLGGSVTNFPSLSIQ